MWMKAKYLALVLHVLSAVEGHVADVFLRYDFGREPVPLVEGPAHEDFGPIAVESAAHSVRRNAGWIARYPVISCRIKKC